MATQQQKVKEQAKRPSATKSGPGRYHASGTKKASPTPTAWSYYVAVEAAIRAPVAAPVAAEEFEDIPF